MEQIKRLFALYQGLHRAYGSYVIEGLNEAKKKMQGKAQTIAGEYNEMCWIPHVEGTRGLGVIPITDDATCNWGAIDVDVYPLDLNVLESRVRSLKLPMIVIRTKSGGAHVTMFLKTMVPASLLRERLGEIAVALGYGGVEIFPKQVKLANTRDTGNWLNMPYFDAKKTTRYAIRNGKTLSLAEFLDMADLYKITQPQLEGMEIKLAETFSDGPPCLQVMAMNGVPEGSRNNALFSMGIYSRLKFGDDWENELDKINHNVMVPPLQTRDVQLVSRSLSRKEYFYPCSKPPLSLFCNKSVCCKREFGIREMASAEIGLNIGDLVKVETDPPIWYLEVEGHRMELDTEDLLSQPKFRKLCVQYLNRLPGTVKASAWEKMVREKLENVKIEKAPIDSGTRGRATHHIEQFFNLVPPARTPEEIFMGRHWTDDITSLTHFRGNDLIRFLETQGLRIEPRKIWASMAAVGAKHNNLVIKGKNVQVWSLELFDDKRDAYEIPEVKGNTAFS
jgi:hypothetical protein